MQCCHTITIGLIEVTLAVDQESREAIKLVLVFPLHIGMKWSVAIVINCIWVRVVLQQFLHMLYMCVHLCARECVYVQYSVGCMCMCAYMCSSYMYMGER